MFQKRQLCATLFYTIVHSRNSKKNKTLKSRYIKEENAVNIKTILSEYNQFTIHSEDTENDYIRVNVKVKHALLNTFIVMSVSSGLITNF